MCRSEKFLLWCREWIGFYTWRISLELGARERLRDGRSIIPIADLVIICINKQMEFCAFIKKKKKELPPEDQKAWHFLAMHGYWVQNRAKAKNSHALAKVHIVDEKFGPRMAFHFLGPRQNIVWGLILCATLTGLRGAQRAGNTFLGVAMRLLPEEISIWTVD